MPFKNPHPLYSVWQDMLGRCRNPNFKQWEDYGGRGITVCERWRSSFQAFVDDMGKRPYGFTLDRKDNDKDYSPDNCQWASRREQQLNRRLAVFVMIEGTRYRAIELAESSGMKTDTIVKRAALGLTYEEVMSPKKRVFVAGLARGGLVSGAKKQAQTHCKHGHEFTPENTYFTKEGWRNCRTCQNAKMRRRSLAARD